MSGSSSNNPLYDTCMAAATGGQNGEAGSAEPDINLFLVCLSENVTANDNELMGRAEQNREFGHTMYLIYSGALVFCMQVRS
jgi:hypothetical protein